MFNFDFKFNIGEFLISLVSSLFIIHTLLFFFNIPITKIASILTFLGITFIYCKNFEFDVIKSIKFILTSVIIIGISIAISLYFFDYSYDGQGYHAEAILKFYNEWNPTKYQYPNTSILALVENHFSKSNWIVASSIYQLVGKFESAKSINLFSGIGAFLYCLPIFVKLLKNNFIAIITCALLIFNPVFCNMYLSNMLDVQVSSFVFALIANYLYIIFSKASNWRDFLLNLLITGFLLNLKFTLVGYIPLFAFGAIIAYFLINKWNGLLKLLAILSINFLFSLLILGYNTYVLNYTQHNHIFFPFKGDTSIASNATVDAMEYRNGNQVVNFYKSHFAKTTFSKAYTEYLEYKIPLSVEKKEIERYAFSGVMIGGFGVLFSAIIIFSYLVLLYFFWYNRSSGENIYPIPILILIGIVIFSSLINPLNYIARYTPQYFLIPIIALIMLHQMKKLKAFYSLFFLLSINSSIVFGAYTYYNTIVTSTRNQQIAKLLSSNQEYQVKLNDFFSMVPNLNERGIKYKIVNEADTKLIDTIFRANSVIYTEK